MYDLQVVYNQFLLFIFDWKILFGLNFVSKVRLCLKFWSGERQTPSKAEMMEDMKREMEKQTAKGHTKRISHLLGADQVVHSSGTNWFRNP